MPAETWGMMEKSAVDNEKIEEAIARLITAHEADSEAHLGAGESLQSHKSEDVIDHPAQSLVPDKISNSWVRFFTDFASVDSFFTWGYASGSFPGCTLTVVTGEQSISYLESYMSIWYGHSFFSSSCILDFMSMLGSADDTVRYNIGFHQGTAGGGTWNGGNGVYFLWENGKLYARAKSSTQTIDVEIVGATVGVLHAYRIFFDSTDDLIHFFIDGIEVAALAIPTSFTTNALYFKLEIQGVEENYENSLYVSALDISFEVV